MLQSFCEGRLFAERASLEPTEVIGLHGWARSREDLAGPLAGLNALAVDLPGFGASPEPPEAWDSRAYAALIAEVLAGLDRPQVLLGHSFGGRVAVKLAAGWLVERAGFGKGYPGDGAPARLSTKHALAVTNRGGATTMDVISLARAVRDGVRTTFGIDLTPEPILIGCTF